MPLEHWAECESAAGVDVVAVVGVAIGAGVGVGVAVALGAGVGDASVVVGVGNVGVMVDAGADVQAVSSAIATADIAASKARAVGGLSGRLDIVLPFSCGSRTWGC